MPRKRYPTDANDEVRVAQRQRGQPSAVAMDGRSLQSSGESGPCAGYYDGYKRRHASKIHMAADTLGHRLAVHVTPTDEQVREQVKTL